MEYTCEEQARYATLNQTFASEADREEFIKNFIIKCNAKNTTPTIETGGIKPVPVLGGSIIAEPEIVNSIPKPVSPTKDVINLMPTIMNPAVTGSGETTPAHKCKTCFWQYVAIAVLGAYILFGKKK